MKKIYNATYDFLFVKHATDILMFLVILAMLLVISGCSSNPADDDTKSLIETLEFGDDECGQFQLTGDVEVGSSPLPFFKTKLHMNLDKQKECVE